MTRRLTERERKILILCLGMLFFAIFYNGIISPLQAKIEFLDEEILVRQKQFDRDLEVIKRAKALDGPYDVYLKQLSQSGLEEEAVSLMLSEIEGVVGDLGLHVLDLKPQKVKRSDYGHQFSVTLTIHSGLKDIIRFLYILQPPPHLFDVEEVEFEKLVGRGQEMITTHLILSKAFIPSGTGAEVSLDED